MHRALELAPTTSKQYSGHAKFFVCAFFVFDAFSSSFFLFSVSLLFPRLPELLVPALSPAPFSPPSFCTYDAQVEARLRQLEGRQLGSEAAKPRGVAQPQKYDAARQSGASAALLTQPKTYNPDADVTADAEGKSGKKKKKEVRVGTHGCLCCSSVLRGVCRAWLALPYLFGLGGRGNTLKEFAGLGLPCLICLGWEEGAIHSTLPLRPTHTRAVEGGCGS
jgi:hypothetical protein